MPKDGHSWVKLHQRRHPGPRKPKAPPPPPMPGNNDFDAGQEQAMRMGQRQANMAPPPMDDNDADDLGGM